MACLLRKMYQVDRTFRVSRSNDTVARRRTFRLIPIHLFGLIINHSVWATIVIGPGNLTADCKPNFLLLSLAFTLFFSVDSPSRHCRVLWRPNIVVPVGQMRIRKLITKTQRLLNLYTTFAAFLK